MSGQKTTNEMLMLARIADTLSLIFWAKTEDAAKGRNRPESILDFILNDEPKNDGYASGEEFMRERERLLERIQANGC